MGLMLVDSEIPKPEINRRHDDYAHLKESNFFHYTFIKSLGETCFLGLGVLSFPSAMFVLVDG